MAPLPPESTSRYFVDYTANGRNHTAQFRYTSPEDAAPGIPFQDAVDDFMQAIGSAMPTDYAILGYRFAETDSNVTNPVARTIATVSGIYTPHLSDAPAFLGFVGRTSGGRRVRMQLLGAGYDPSEIHGVADNYRVLASESSDFADMISALEAIGSKAIDGLTPSWKQYVNLGYNAYWQRQVRG